MILYRICVSLAFVSSGFLFGADPDHHVSCTLKVSPTEKYYVPKASFDASRKLCTLNEEKIEHGNVLCAKYHLLTNRYVIKELWYRINGKSNKDKIPIEVVSEHDWYDAEFDLPSLNTKQKALQYISHHQPRGLDGKECVLKGEYGRFVAPQNAVLLYLLQRNDESAFEHTFNVLSKKASIFCVSAANAISHLYFVKNNLKIGDQEQTCDIYGLSHSIGIPGELQVYNGREFKDQEEALKALKDHIDVTYFSIK